MYAASYEEMKRRAEFKQTMKKIRDEAAKQQAILNAVIGKR